MVWQSILGIIVFIGIAILLSENQGKISWRIIFFGLGSQLLLAVILIKVPFFQIIFIAINNTILALQNATKAGTSFVFGYLGGGTLPFSETYPEATFIIAFQALPLILFVSALSSLLFHWRILPFIIQGFSYILERTFRIGGATSLATAANIFIGMVEAPILIRPYLNRLGRGELFIVMTAGMATVAGTVLLLYAALIGDIIADAISHILIASLMSAPAAIMIAKLLIPDSSQTSGSIKIPQNSSAMGAIAQGTTEGIKLLINIIAMLIVMVALVELVNILLSLLPTLNSKPLTLERILGWLMAPIVWLMGIHIDDATTAGRLIGIKIVLNEFLAYVALAGETGQGLSERSKLIMTYGLCGFANFGSLGIMIGGLTGLAPERRNEIISLSGKSMISGTLATCMTGSVAGILL